MDAPSRVDRYVVWSTAVATPVACAVEYALRVALFPPDFEELRSYLRPALAAPAWALAALTLVAAAVAHRVEPRLEARLAAHAPPRRARMTAFFLATSLPQLVALVATFAFTCGAPFAPVAVTMAVATTGVALQGLRAARGAR